jgi:hypothetical protein
MVDQTYNPPRHLVERLQELEAQEKVLREQLEAEAAKAAVPPLQA